MRTVVLERAPTLAVPPCREAPRFDVADSFHVRCTSDAENPDFDRWVTQDRLAEWKLVLPGQPGAQRTWRPTWAMNILLAARRVLNQDVLLDPERVGWILHVQLGVPEAALPKWTSVVSHATAAMLAAMHTYDADEVNELFASAPPETLAALRDLLTTPAPLGPAALQRWKSGKIRDLPTRDDRVVAIRARVVPLEGYTFEGRIETGRPGAGQKPACS